MRNISCMLSNTCAAGALFSKLRSAWLAPLKAWQSAHPVCFTVATSREARELKYGWSKRVQAGASFPFLFGGGEEKFGPTEKQWNRSNGTSAEKRGNSASTTGLLTYSIRLTNEAIIDLERSCWLAQLRPLSGSSSPPPLRSRWKCQGHCVRRSTQFYRSPICRRLITGPPHGRSSRAPLRDSAGENLIFAKSGEEPN